MTSEALLEHWQGHRRVTRRVIDAFPEDKLFTFSVGGMRPFGVLALELLTMGAPMVKGAATGQWDNDASRDELPKADLLKKWDASTEEINALWKEIPLERFGETMTAFGQYTDKTYNLLLYVIDNEIHHRAQGYVYLRALDITPPAFYDRS
jgi:uncharacterized damage-inducible protein DinB